MSNRIEFIDVQHFLLCLREMSGMMVEDRPGDSDAQFLWVTFNSCVTALNMIGKVNSKVLKIILSVGAPIASDRHSPSKYIKMICVKSEGILDEIGWPSDVGDT